MKNGKVVLEVCSILNRSLIDPGYGTVECRNEDMGFSLEEIFYETKRRNSNFK